MLLLFFPLVASFQRKAPIVRDYSRSCSSNIELDNSRIGAANLDWGKLGFQYRDTNGFAYTTYNDGDEWKLFVKLIVFSGKWDDNIVFKSSPYLPVHIGATALHYGQG